RKRGNMESSHHSLPDYRIASVRPRQLWRRCYDDGTTKRGGAMMRAVVAAAAVFAMNGNAAVAQTSPASAPYPSKPIRFIIPFVPGGAGDAVMRIVGQKLTDTWGQPSIMDNRAGA